LNNRENRVSPWRLRLAHRLALACLVLALNEPASALAAQSDWWIVAQLTEKSFGSEDLPSPTPTASPAAGAPEDSQSDWQRTTTAAPEAAEEQAAPLTEAPTATTARGLAEPTPRPTPGEEMAPLSIGSVAPTVSVSTLPLEPLIRDANSPARATSLKLTEQARLAMVRGENDEVVALLTRAVSIDPTNYYAYFFLARAYMDSGQYEQAVGFFKRAENGFASNPAWLAETLAFEGLAYERIGRLTAAEATYQKALDAAPGHLMARVGYTRVTALVHRDESTAGAIGAPPEGPAIEPPPSQPPPPAPPAESAPSSD
jgi:hypothetical protein